MTKSLEAYNVLLKAWQGNKEAKDYPDFDDINEALDTIKQDLKKLEQLEKENESLNNIIETDIKDLQELRKENQDLKIENFDLELVLNGEIDKLKKAIEVLKDKYDFDIYYNENFTTPTLTINCDYFKELTQQEYELLKEVLEND